MTRDKLVLQCINGARDLERLARHEPYVLKGSANKALFAVNQTRFR